MTAEQFRAGRYLDAPKDKQKDGGFTSRVSVKEGTTPPSRVRPVDQPQLGNIHRQSVKKFEQHSTDHLPYSSAHRPAEPQNLDGLKAHQTKMLSERQRRKNKRKG